MKRIIAMLSIFVLLAPMVACNANSGSQSGAQVSQVGEGSAASGAAKTVTLWLPPFATSEALDEEIWAPIIASFEEENNCKVNFTVIPWDGYEEKYLTAIAGKSGPDVAYMYIEMFPAFIQMGAVSDIDSYFTKEEKDLFYNWGSGHVMNGQYGVPFAWGDPRVVMYNKSILDEIGEAPPKTWEDMRRIATAATQDKDGDGSIDQWGYATSFADSYYGFMSAVYFPFLWQAGGEVYNEAGDKVIINSPEAKRAAQFVYDLIHVDKVVPDDWSSVKLEDMFLNYFCTGKAAMILSPSSFGDIHLSNYPDLEFGYVTALEDQKSITFAPTDFLTLMSAAQDTELAIKLLKKFVSIEAIDRYHEFQGDASPRRDAPYLGSEIFKDAYANEATKMRPYSAALECPNVYDYLYRQLQQIMNNQISIDDGLAEVERYGNQAIEDFIARG